MARPGELTYYKRFGETGRQHAILKPFSDEDMCVAPVARCAPAASVSCRSPGSGTTGSRAGQRESQRRQGEEIDAADDVTDKDMPPSYGIAILHTD